MGIRNVTERADLRALAATVVAAIVVVVAVAGAGAEAAAVVAREDFDRREMEPTVPATIGAEPYPGIECTPISILK